MSTSSIRRPSTSCSRPQRERHKQLHSHYNKFFQGCNRFGIEANNIKLEGDWGVEGINSQQTSTLGTMTIAISPRPVAQAKNIVTLARMSYAIKTTSINSAQSMVLIQERIETDSRWPDEAITASKRTIVEGTAVSIQPQQVKQSKIRRL